MKTKLIIAAVVLTLASAIQALAQGGTVGWVGVAGACSIDSKSAPRKISFGTVSFNGVASGNIYVNCPIDAITRIDPLSVNAWGLIFRNDNGVVGGVNKCTISAQFIQVPNSNPTLPVLLGTFTTAGTSYSGFTTVDPLPIGAFLDVNNNQYVVSISLNRVSGATCNPQIWVTFAENIII
ncbi:MAG TPA: hypothetical protein VJP02_05530 [Candidatus Sulfotelmatobacter sp.]|nr:hypothetical protein [Candidatus Sulfotelmatobacter sp.]